MEKILKENPRPEDEQPDKKEADEKKTLWEEAREKILSTEDRMDKRTKFILRRSMGYTFEEATPAARMAFYMVIPQDMTFYNNEWGRTERDIWFFGICLYAYQDSIGFRKTEDILSEIYNDRNTTGSQKAKIRALISYNMTDDGRIIHYLSKKLKSILYKTNDKISVPSLVASLLTWNRTKSGYSAADRWAEKIARNYKVEEKEEGNTND